MPNKFSQDGTAINIVNVTVKRQSDSKTILEMTAPETPIEEAAVMARKITDVLDDICPPTAQSQAQQPPSPTKQPPRTSAKPVTCGWYTPARAGEAQGTYCNCKLTKDEVERCDLERKETDNPALWTRSDPRHPKYYCSNHFDAATRPKNENAPKAAGYGARVDE